MNTEVIAKVENEEDEKTESCTEGEFVELGRVSRDTQGFGYVFPDGGIGNYFS